MNPYQTDTMNEHRLKQATEVLKPLLRETYYSGNKEFYFELLGIVSSIQDFRLEVREVMEKSVSKDCDNRR